jgi:hypothetical protein
MQASFLLLLVFILDAAVAEDVRHEIGGHTKFRFIGRAFPDDSLFHDLAGATAGDLEADLRLDFSASRGVWSLDAAYQLFTLFGDTIEYTRDQDDSLFGERLPGDARRLFDLTGVIHDDGRTAVAHRLDRLRLSYTGEKTVLRIGRQALSWGNGLFYSPMDLVNPFDPTAIDTEFKPGDDMLYMQYLRDNGDDLQAAVVPGRNPESRSVDSDQATIAIKYHGFAGDSEFDVLFAESYADSVFGIGGVRSLGGAVMRGDIVITDTATDTHFQLVANLSYSWSWSGKNVSGAIEYYYNGFGQRDQQYDLASLAGNPDLVNRLARAELFALGRNYVAGSISIELTPLFTLSPTLLANIDDPSALLQVVAQHSLSDNMTFLGSLNIPAGSDGSEFGGIGSGIPGRYLSTSASLFAQLAWYF